MVYPTFRLNRFAPGPGYSECHEEYMIHPIARQAAYTYQLPQSNLKLTSDYRV
jgi:hypothetical protein